MSLVEADVVGFSDEVEGGALVVPLLVVLLLSAGGVVGPEAESSRVLVVLEGLGVFDAIGAVVSVSAAGESPLGFVCIGWDDIIDRGPDEVPEDVIGRSLEAVREGKPESDDWGMIGMDVEWMSKLVGGREIREDENPSGGVLNVFEDELELPSVVFGDKAVDPS